MTSLPEQPSPKRLGLGIDLNFLNPFYFFKKYAVCCCVCLVVAAVIFVVLQLL